MSAIDPAVRRGAPDGTLQVGTLARRILTDDVHESLTALIMDHVIPPDTKVSIDELSRKLGVSQTPIREALARLEAAGLVRKEALRGYFTTPLLNREQFDNLFEFRRHLEPWAAETAAGKLTPEGARLLRAEMKTASQIPRGSDYESYKTLAAHDSRFHALIFDLAGNPVMREAFDGTCCHLHLFRLYYGTALASPATKEHRRIVSAITAKDAKGAHDAMLAHVNSSYERLVGAAT